MYSYNDPLLYILSQFTSMRTRSGRDGVVTAPFVVTVPTRRRLRFSALIYRKSQSVPISSSNTSGAMINSARSPKYALIWPSGSRYGVDTVCILQIFTMQLQSSICTILQLFRSFCSSYARISSMEVLAHDTCTLSIFPISTLIRNVVTPLTVPLAMINDEDDIQYRRPFVNFTSCALFVLFFSKEIKYFKVELYSCIDMHSAL